MEHTPGRRPRAGAGIVLEVGLWTAVGILFWLATASSVTAAEALAAAPFGLAAGILARMARRALPFRARPLRVWVVWAAAVPVAAATDLARLAGWFRGAQPEEVHTAPLPRGDGPRETAWRAGGTAALSATPGTLVLNADAATGTAVVHTLVQGWPHLDTDVLRAEATQKGQG